MDDASTRLLDAFTVALPRYLLDLVGSRGWVAAGLDEAADEAAQWLRRELRDLLDLPYARQPRSPLEIAQEATAIVGDALDAAGVEPPARDAATIEALPGDVYDLAPASSTVLGEAAWEAHIAWGVTKAAAMTAMVQRPVAAYVGRNLMDRTRLASVAEAAGYSFDEWEPDTTQYAVALVDLADPRADDAIGALAEAGVRVIGFGPHVDDVAMARAGALGASEVVARSRFFSRLPEWFAPVV